MLEQEGVLVVVIDMIII